MNVLSVLVCMSAFVLATMLWSPFPVHAAYIPSGAPRPIPTPGPEWPHPDTPESETKGLNYVDQPFTIDWGTRDYVPDAMRIPQTCWYLGHPEGKPNRYPIFEMRVTVELPTGPREMGTTSIFPQHGPAAIRLQHTPGGRSMDIGGGGLAEVWVDLARKLRDVPRGSYVLQMDLRNHTNKDEPECTTRIRVETYRLEKRTDAERAPDPKIAQKKNAPDPTAKEIALPGRSVRSTVHTVEMTGAAASYYDRVHADLNRSIRNLKASIEPEKGSVCFAFDFEEGRAPSWQAVGVGTPILIRLFDKGGNYLTHIQTQESFGSPSQFGPYSENALRFSHAQELRRTGNHFCYQINMRDASFTSFVEIGFLALPQR